MGKAEMTKTDKEADDLPVLKLALTYWYDESMTT